jgi:pterin-4a-carbinolamine dehydratase
LGVRRDLSLHTKKIKGLHENDFIMAAKLDHIVTEQAMATV